MVHYSGHALVGSSARLEGVFILSSQLGVLQGRGRDPSSFFVVFSPLLRRGKAHPQTEKL